MPLRTRKAATLFGIETTAGTDPGLSASDVIAVENFRVSFNPQNDQTNEESASLDPLAPLVGGVQVEISFDV